MSEIQPIFDSTLDFARTGFSTATATLGLLIALIAAFMTHSYKQIFVISLGAALLTIVIEAVLPVIAETGAFRVPQVLEGGFWSHFAYLFVGYVILIFVFYSLRKMLLGGSHAH